MQAGAHGKNKAAIGVSSWHRVALQTMTPTDLGTMYGR